MAKVDKTKDELVEGVKATGDSDTDVAVKPPTAEVSLSWPAQVIAGLPGPLTLTLSSPDFKADMVRTLKHAKVSGNKVSFRFVWTDPTSTTTLVAKAGEKSVTIWKDQQADGNGLCNWQGDLADLAGDVPEAEPEEEAAAPLQPLGEPDALTSTPFDCAL